jgi:hypothetical protein
MSIAESSRSRWSVSSLPTKSSTPRTFSCCVATTSARGLIGFTDSTMSAAVAFQSRCGSNFATRLTVCLAVPSLTIRLFACTEVFPRNSVRWNKLPTLRVLAMSLIRDYCAISSGLTRIPVLPYVYILSLPLFLRPSFPPSLFLSVPPSLPPSVSPSLFLCDMISLEFLF